jgi:hypothetical protein
MNIHMRLCQLHVVHMHTNLRMLVRHSMTNAAADVAVAAAGQ